MKFPFSWLNDFIDLEALLKKESNINKIAESLTMAGIEVEELVENSFYEGNVVVGVVKNVSQHPTTEKLNICEVDIGKGENEIVVTADKTVSKGDKVAYCFPGTLLKKTGRVIEPMDFEHIRSNGMLLSLEELGIEEKSSVVWRIKEDIEIGTEIIDIITLPFLKKEYIFNVKTPSNRADVLSVLGIARELSAIYNIPLKPLNFELPNANLPAPDIKVEDSRCYRYCSRVAKNIKVEESSTIIKIRLLQSGVRSINNIVDITNYVMLAIGQPMHAFDYDKLEGKKIIVRPSKKGETILTLDGSNIELPEGTMIIADEKRPVAVAGVIGGEETGVTDSTTSILFESAYFDYNSIRTAVKRIGISTESSNRFSRDIGFYTTELAINMAISLLGLTNISQLKDIKTKKLETPTIKTSFKEINDRIGHDIPEKTTKVILANLGFGISQKQDELIITIPPYRMDISILEDIVEEVSRIYGYNNIPPTIPKINKNPEIPSNVLAFESRIRNNLVSQGLTEVMNISFVSEKDLKLFKLSNLIDDDKVIRISNPMNNDETLLKPLLIINVLKTLRTNINYGNKNLSVFEIGKVFTKSEGKPKEEKHLCIALYGKKYDNWAGKENFSFFELKDIIDRLIISLGNETNVEPINTLSFLHPYISGKLIIGGEEVGIIGKLHPEVTKNFDLEEVYMCEINLDKLEEKTKKHITFEEIKRFPVSPRNISVIVPKNYYVGKLVEFIKNYKTSKDITIVEVRVVDIYEGSPIPEGYKSVNILMKFQGVRNVQKDDEVNAEYLSLINEIREKLGFSVRGVE
jgi:phenylalanyl-tRNA synthetase beta chain